jgi:hypothetical protein
MVHFNLPSKFHSAFIFLVVFTEIVSNTYKFEASHFFPPIHKFRFTKPVTIVLVDF